jgi:two-component system sensor histidine kinase HydH
VGFRIALQAPVASLADRSRGQRVDVSFEFVPLEARMLRAAAARTFRIAAVTAFLLAALALALFRRVLRREAMAVQLERAQRLASVGELSAVLAHEIRNPLASLKGNAQLLATSLPSGETPRVKAERVVEEALRLETLVEDLLELARTGQLERLPRSPACLIAEAVEALAATPAWRSPCPARERCILVDVSRAPSSWSLDGERMVEALTKLLENAVQAGMPVRASVALAGSQLVFEVQDGGAGVPDEMKERIFEPFHTQRARGAGLGLAVARRIGEMHGGCISVSDGSTGGAVFRISLPPS